MISLYVRMIDDALAEAVDRNGEARIYNRSRLMDHNRTIENFEPSEASVADSVRMTGDASAKAVDRSGEAHIHSLTRPKDRDRTIGKYGPSETPVADDTFP